MKDLCTALAQADSESEIVQVLKDEGYWDNHRHWQYFAAMENSFSIIGNQQALPESALVEKIINSIDAVLMSESLKRRIHPESKEAPQTIWEAVEKFFGIKGGFLYNLGSRERADLGERTVNVVASGSRALPCYTFIDFGEGQTANTMPKTLLSLVGSNKLKIPFVQGKFNMGGTGVFLFCGDRNMQVMVTRRHPEVAKFEKDDVTREDWCFTVVRREDPREGQKHSVFTYLAPNGKIPHFKTPSLPLFPRPYPEPYGQEVEQCTFIKIIEYQIPRYKTNITLDMYNRLNCLLPRLALPVRLWERRKGWGPGTHSFETTLAGLSVRLEEDKRGMLEFSSSATFDVDGLKMPTTIYAFKSKEQADRYRNEEGIIFVQNGQTQGHLTKDFFKRKKAAMMNIADLILVEVDCDEIDRRAREKLFMNSRDRLRNGQLKKDIEDQLEILISEHQGLREFRERKVRDEIKERLSQAKPLENVLQKIIKNNPTLAKILGTGARISSPFSIEAATTGKEFKGKKFPTYFNLKGGKSAQFTKSAHLGQRFRAQFDTDAENDYFKRDEDKGVMTILCGGEKYGSGVANLWNGVCTLNLESPEDAEVGNSYSFEVQVSDPSRIFPFTNVFKVQILDQAPSPTTSEVTQRKPPVTHGKGDEQKPQTLGIPEVTEVTEPEWPNFGFDKESGLALRQRSEDEYYFAVNVDNLYLKTEQKIARSDSVVLKEQFKYGLSLVALALLNAHEKSNNGSKLEGENGEGEKIDETIKDVTRALSPFILPIVRELGSLNLE